MFPAISIKGYDMAMKGNSFMHRVMELIVKSRWVFIILFVAAIVFSAFSVQWIQIENDIKAYLPDSSEAKQGLQIMNREFVTYGTADIMVQDVNREEAMEIYLTRSSPTTGRSREL